MPDYKTPKYIEVKNSGQTPDSVNEFGKIDGCYQLYVPSGSEVANEAKLAYKKTSIDWTPRGSTYKSGIVVTCCEEWGADYYMMNGNYATVWKEDMTGPELRNGKPYWKLITKRKEDGNYYEYPPADRIINTIEWKPPPGESDSSFCNWRIGTTGPVKHHGTWVMRSSEKKPSSPGTTSQKCCPDDDGYGVVYAYQVKKIDGVPGLTGQEGILEGKYANEYPKNGPWIAVCSSPGNVGKWGNPCLTTHNMFKNSNQILKK